VARVVPSRAAAYSIDRHGHSKFWRLSKGNRLVVVTVYKKGAEAVRDEFQALESKIADLSQALESARTEGTGQAARAGAVERLQEGRQSGNARQR
jgi:hypothetical protein